jgi:hypothetical protein
MPAGAGRDSERFAAAVDFGVDAVPPGDDLLHRELDVVALLRQSKTAMSPGADASARMRARVMAAAATMLPEQGSAPAAPSLSSLSSATPIVNEQSFADAPTTFTTPVISDDTELLEATDADTGADEPSRSNVFAIGKARGRHRFPNTAPSPQRRGLLGISAAAALMVLAVTGGGAMFSQGALPGDSLYGVKQTTESALVGLTPGQGNKAQRQLDYAATRIDEVQQLNSEQVPADNRSADISQALQGFNEQTASGSRLWLASAGSGNSAELGTLANWAQTQSQKLSAMRSSMPAGAQPDADHSLRILEDLRTRATSLSNRQGCDKVTSGDSDQLGPLPAKGACSSKDSTTAPNSINTVAPSDLPGTSGRSSEDSDSSDPSSDSDSSTDSTKNNKSKDESPGLPGLGDLTGGGSHSDVGKLPTKEQTKGGDPLPSSTEQAPKTGLNLPSLLPILLKPLDQSGTAPKGTG